MVSKLQKHLILLLLAVRLPSAFLQENNRKCSEFRDSFDTNTCLFKQADGKKGEPGQRAENGVSLRVSKSEFATIESKYFEEIKYFLDVTLSIILFCSFISISELSGKISKSNTFVD